MRPPTLLIPRSTARAPGKQILAKNRRRIVSEGVKVDRIFIEESTLLDGLRPTLDATNQKIGGDVRLASTDEVGPAYTAILPSRMKVTLAVKLFLGTELESVWERLSQSLAKYLFGQNHHLENCRWRRGLFLNQPLKAPETVAFAMTKITVQAGLKRGSRDSSSGVAISLSNPHDIGTDRWYLSQRLGMQPVRFVKRISPTDLF